MRKGFCLPLWIGLLATTVPAATIQFQVTDLGGTAHRYTYFPSGFMLQANQELDIRFDPALYGMLSNGIAPGVFDLLLIQPNNPLGGFGDYSALAKVNNPSLAGPFSVDFIFKGAGAPGAQPFVIFDQSGIQTVTQGTTTPFGAPGVPEPGTFPLGAAALFMGGVLWSVRRGAGRTAGR